VLGIWDHQTPLQCAPAVLVVTGKLEAPELVLHNRRKCILEEAEVLKPGDATWK